MSDAKLISLAKELVDQLGPCPISVRILQLVLQDRFQAKQMAQWEITGQESRLSKLDIFENFSDFVDQLTWLVFLLNTAGSHGQARDHGFVFLHSLDVFDSEIQRLGPSIMAGIGYVQVIATKTDPLDETAEPSVIASAMREKLSLPRHLDIVEMQDRLLKFFQPDDAGDYPVLRYTWEPLFLAAWRELHDEKE